MTDQSKMASNNFRPLMPIFLRQKTREMSQRPKNHPHDMTAMCPRDTGRAAMPSQVLRKRCRGTEMLGVNTFLLGVVTL